MGIMSQEIQHVVLNGFEQTNTLIKIIAAGDLILKEPKLEDEQSFNQENVKKLYLVRIFCLQKYKRQQSAVTSGEI